MDRIIVKYSLLLFLLSVPPIDYAYVFNVFWTLVEGSLRRLMMSFEQVTQESGLTINVAKTKQLITLSDRKDPKDRMIDVNLSIRGENVERVKEFVYFGSVVSETGSSIHDINRRISSATYKFNKLEKEWKQ